MRLHRFYVTQDTELQHDFWLHDIPLLKQWNRVLRFRPNQQVILFNDTHERLYRLAEIKPDEAHLLYVTDFERKLPSKNIYLLWSLLKKDKNDWVLQKCTELGVSHFIPILADRSEKTGFDQIRAHKIIIEATEQCGRSDVPNVREPILISTALEELQKKVNLYVAEQDTAKTHSSDLISSGPVGVFIGPEGGWSDAEKQYFNDNNLKHLNLHDFTLRAETAAVAACTLLVQ